MFQKKVEDCLGKTIKVTYDAWEAEDVYNVLRIDVDDQIVIRRPKSEEFTVSRSWFTRADSGRNIEIIN